MPIIFFVLLFLWFAGADEEAKIWPTTLPFWPHYPYRNKVVLDGKWEFGYSDAVGIII
jgi:hypothetical protein